MKFRKIILAMIVCLSIYSTANAQTLQINNFVNPTCTQPNSGSIQVELVGSPDPDVIFIFNGLTINGPIIMRDTTDVHVIDYTGLPIGNYFIDVQYLNLPPPFPSGVQQDLVIDEPEILVQPPVTICSNDGLQDLLALAELVDTTGFTGGTWTFSGPGPSVNGNLFDPSGFNGPVDIVVNYDLGACSVTSIGAISFVVELAAVLTPFPTTVCQDDAPFDLNTFILENFSGGVFTFVGPGVVNDSIFDPSLVAPGLSQIQASYVFGNCTTIDTIDITVQELPVLTLPPTSVCANSAVLDLNTIVSSSVAGGTFGFSGPGVTGTDFDPSGLSGAQNINVLWGNGVCTETGVLVITVEDTPVITLNPTTPLCTNSGVQDLNSMVSALPAGGVFSFSGPGVTGSNFDPSGQGGNSVNIDVTYVLGTCTVLEVLVIDVEAEPTITLNPTSPLCDNAGIQDLTTMVTVNPAGGALSFAGPGVAGNNFDPSALGGTTANIDVTYSIGACTVMEVLVIDVETAPILTLTPVTPVCGNFGLQDLTTMVSANPAGGTFSFAGTGVTGANFDPFGLSGNISIDVTYVLGSCTVVETMIIEVEPTPVLTLTPVTPVCDADSPYDLLTMVSADVGGGTFSFAGPGVTGNLFDPMGQSGMVNITVEYQVGVCMVSEVMIIDVEQAPVLTLTPVTPLCVNAGPQDISTWATANPAGGTFTFSGPGVTGTTFDPIGLNGFINIDVQYSFGACVVNDIMTVDIQSLPTVTLSPPAAICNDDGLQNLLSFVAVNPTGGALTFAGAGVIGTNFNPSGLIGPIDIQVTYNLSSCIRIDTMTLNLNDAATVNAGVDQVVCETDLVTLAGAIGGGATSSIWTSTGTGLFDDPTSLNAVYTPSTMDRTNGSVIMTLITNDPDGAGPCSVQSSSLTVTFNPAAVVDAGMDQTICEGDDATINGTVSGAAINPMWTTLGGGTFNDPAQLSTTYFPDASDIAAGMVQLVLTTDDPDGAGGCPAGADTVDIVINAIPTVDAGMDLAIPAGNMVNLNGVIGGSATSATWSSNGTGVFDDITSLTAVYTPSAADIIAGSVILILTTDDPDGAGPCTAQSDLMTVLIVTGNTVIAGADQDLCEGDDVILNGVVACIANGITWTTTGTGTFADADALSTFYVPSPADVAADSILMILNIDDPASSLGCVPTADTLVVRINPTPVADAGTDVTICQGDATQLQGSGGLTYLWAPAAGLDDPTLANPMASPNMTTTYTLTVTDNFGCTDTARVTVDVIITTPPTVVSPVDICQDFVAPRLMATGTNLVWYTDAALTNQVATGDEYQPGPAELDVTTVGTTIFFVTQDVGCGASTAAQVVVNVFDRNDAICNTLCPTVDFVATPTDVVCFGDATGSIELTNIVGSGGSSPLLDVLLDGNSVGQTDQTQFTIPNLAAGSYEVTLQQTGVCTNLLTTTVTISQPPFPIQIAIIDPIISLSEQGTGVINLVLEGTALNPPVQVSIELIDPAFPPQSLFVDFTDATLNPTSGDYEITFTNLFAGTYRIDALDAQGCTRSITFTLGFDETLFIPNIFTPNDDGVNDTFSIRNLPDGSPIVVSDRWGKIVFESNNYANDWDGQDNADGTYFYRIEIDGQIYKGWVEIWSGSAP